MVGLERLDCDRRVERAPVPGDLLSGFQRLQERAEDLGAASDLRAIAFYAYWAWGAALYPEETARLIKEHDLWPHIYTPGVAPAMRYAVLLEKHLPQAALPLVIPINDPDFLALVKDDEAQAVDQVENLIKEAAERIYNFLKAPGDPEWSKELLKQMVICDCDGGRPLAEDDLAVSAGQITAGKLICVNAVTEGRLARTLMLGILLDVGTDRRWLLDHDQYRGIKRPRLRMDDEDYRRAMRVVKQAYQNLGIAFVLDEDFAGSEAWFNMALARELLGCYLDDDVEGTGSLMAEILLLAQRQGVNLEQAAIICHGAGGAGTGIYDQARLVFRDQIPEEVFRRLFWLIDTAGLLVMDRAVKQGRGRSEFRHFQRDLGLIVGQNGDDPRLEAVQAFRRRDGRGTDQAINLVETIRLAAERIRENDEGAIFLYGFAMSLGSFDDEVVVALAKAGVQAYMVAGSNPFKKCEILTEEDLEEMEVLATKEEKMGVVRRRIEYLYQVYVEVGGDPDNLRMALGSGYVRFTKPDGRPGIAAQGNNLFTFGAIIEAVVQPRFNQLTNRMKAEAARAGAEYMLAQEQEALALGALYPRRDNLSRVILAKEAAMIWAGLMDNEVEIGNERWRPIRAEIQGFACGRDPEEARALGIGRVRKELERIQLENKKRIEAIIQARREKKSENEVARWALRYGMAVLNDKELVQLVATVDQDTP